MAFAPTKENEKFIDRTIRLGRQKAALRNLTPLIEEEALRIYAPNRTNVKRELALARACLSALRKTGRRKR